MPNAAPVPNFPHDAPFPPVLGQIGTLMVCIGALIAQLSPPQVQPLAIGMWLIGLLMQIAAFALAVTVRRQSPGNLRS